MMNIFPVSGDKDKFLSVCLWNWASCFEQCLQVGFGRFPGKKGSPLRARDSLEELWILQSTAVFVLSQLNFDGTSIRAKLEGTG